MAQLQFYVNHQIIRRTDKFKVVSDSRNYLYAEFNFGTDEWEGKTITAIFRTSSDAYEVILDENNTCLVPWEVLQKPYQGFYVSCFAGDLITVNTAQVVVIESGYDDDSESSQPPTPSVYAQILEKLDDAKHNVDGGLFTDWNE